MFKKSKRFREETYIYNNHALFKGVNLDIL